MNQVQKDVTSTTYDLIKELFLLIDDGDRQLLDRFDLTVPRFYALVHLHEQPGLSPHQLSDLMFCDRSNITRLVRGMASEGLLVKRKHESDGRSIRLFLTEQGESVCTQAIDAHQRYNRERFMMMDDMPSRLLLQLERLKDRLSHDLEERF